ncbi:MAG: hypothetical protein HY927_14435 [Elusimicrobia bacterium]|nr:hypothetical protein [Elusimicrobiota bacterium]
MREERGSSMLAGTRGRGRTDQGFTVVESAVIVVVVAGLFYVATFQEGPIIGTGVLIAGLSLCAALAARKRGRRLMSAAFIVGSLAAAGWMMRACTKSLADHGRPQDGRRP